ncbi:NhaP-type Na+/H+ or K+/H+ antiporter [Anaerosporobacter mobilis DSM 15930]|uniref:NhaP-type Na+/H+ or K+/H+ antiporter n=1 Tax=Anaerosporobacter mobilis DSM 15930 TaxID=1120996 RepID=A0A1M7JYV4_9FIRM|nr:cation:proton antiporter [Anaerosporobacter mobilis]SHM58219.1 NhaP-type Na+/H+ or K+/H+ antiporter [Anaerosporobacter mobilis DSM 15930]
MLTSLALIFLLGLLLGSIFKKLKLPALLGMIVTGILLSPHALNLLDDSILSISADLRQLALVIILTRAGLSLNLEDLKKVGRPAILMCFVPACFEIVGIVLLAPKLLGVTVIEAAIMGAVVAAVSPAVIVPRMLRLMEEGYGVKHSIPQLILAGASVDDVFVIVLFTSFISLETGGSVSIMDFIKIPISILIGIVVGAFGGKILTIFFRKFHMRDSVKLLIILSISFLLIACEEILKPYVPMSGLISIMVLAIAIYRSYEELANRLSQKYNRLWVAAEVLLFVLVGATVDIENVFQSGIYAAILVVGGLIFRMVGVLVCLIKTKLTKKEKVFCMIAYTPKATVQAAIGAVPLAMGLACGNIVLTVAVLAILITAPFGAILIDSLYKKLCEK